MPDSVRIDPQKVISYLAAPPRNFSSRQSGDWQIMNKKGVLCTVVIPLRAPLFPSQVDQILENAEIDASERLRLIDMWSLPEIYPSV